MNSNRYRSVLPMRLRGPSGRGFTLLELLIVIAIIGILLALLMATVSTAWDFAYDTQCRQNLNQLHKALHMGPNAILPNPIYWVGFAEAMGAQASLLCPMGGGAQMQGVNVTTKPVTPPVQDVPEPPDDSPPPPYDPNPPEQDVGAMNPPVSVIIGTNGHLESNSLIREFREKKNFVLPSSVQTNISSPGKYDGGTHFKPYTGGSVPAGTKINCYFLHFDPVGSTLAETTGQLNFSGKILGVVCQDAALDATDSLLGNSGTAYPTGQKSRGFENNAEIVELSSDMHSFTIIRFKSTTVGEQCRIIVDATSQDPTTGGGGGSTSSIAAGWTIDVDDEYGPGGPTSYGINKFVNSSDAIPGQVLLVEYDRALVDISLASTSTAKDVLTKFLRPRHQGRLNVLYVEGFVDSLEPDPNPNATFRFPALAPQSNGDPWKGRIKK
jgi:prepilin-type N-terminal cleavage/methylation domain-containing protein